MTSMFWTTVIAIYLYDMISRSARSSLFDKNKPAYYWLHLIGWGLPLLLTFTPLVTETFGTLNGEDGWCFLKHREEYPNWTFTFWVIVSFFGWEYLCSFLYLVLMVYIMVSLSCTAKDLVSAERHSKILDNIKKLIWYPLIILFSWMMLLGPETPLLSGILTSVAFFMSSEEAVLQLKKLFRCRLRDAVIVPQDGPNVVSVQLFSSLEKIGLIMSNPLPKNQYELSPADPLPSDYPL
jgi:hypothetical protein